MRVGTEVSVGVGVNVDVGVSIGVRVGVGVEVEVGVIVGVAVDAAVADGVLVVMEVGSGVDGGTQPVIRLPMRIDIRTARNRAGMLAFFRTKAAVWQVAADRFFDIR